MQVDLELSLHREIQTPSPMICERVVRRGHHTMPTNMPYRERRKKADGDVDAVGDFARALFARGLVRATIAVRTSEAQIASVARGAGLIAIVDTIVCDNVPIPRDDPPTGLWQPGTHVHMHVGCVSGRPSRSPARRWRARPAFRDPCNRTVSNLEVTLVRHGQGTTGTIHVVGAVLACRAASCGRVRSRRTLLTNLMGGGRVGASDLVPRGHRSRTQNVRRRSAVLLAYSAQTLR